MPNEDRQSRSDNLGGMDSLTPEERTEAIMPLISRFIVSRLGRDSDWEPVRQQVAFEFWCACKDGYEFQSDPAIAVRIAQSRCLDFLRSKSRHQKLFHPHLPDTGDASARTSIWDTADHRELSPEVSGGQTMLWDDCRRLRRQIDEAFRHRGDSSDLCDKEDFCYYIAWLKNRHGTDSKVSLRSMENLQDDELAKVFHTHDFTILKKEALRIRLSKLDQQICVMAGEMQDDLTTEQRDALFQALASAYSVFQTISGVYR